MEKRTATIGEETIVYAHAGSGGPAIVLINGAGGPLDAWRWIWPDLAAQASVVAYNRPGIDGSSEPKCAQTSDVIVASLRTLLWQLEIAPPYVLVGHSLGGLHVNYFARRHPEEVAAVVYLDAAAPDDIALMTALKGPIAGVVERVIDTVFPKNERAETNQVARSVELIAFPGVPVVVVSGARRASMPNLAREGRARNQTALAAASPRGKQIIAKRSGHFPQITEPKLVIAAIIEARISVR